MCGLVGMAGDLSGNKKKAFEDLLIVDVVRGPHSTGVGVVNRFNKSKMEVSKAVGPPIELMSTKQYQEMMRGQFKAFIGHNRYATIGKVNEENAHPFMFENVIGAHNGTLEYMCREKLHNSKEYGTDSEAVFSHINEYGSHKTFELIHNPTYNNNAWALTWFDAEENTINIARNSKRPLYYTYSKDGCTLFWASELDMLKWVLHRNNIETSNELGYVVNEDSHYKWEIPGSIAGKFDHPKISKIEKPKPIAPEWSFRPHEPTYHTPKQSNIFQFIDKKKKARLEIDTKTFRPPYLDHTGKAMKKVVLMDKIADGCTFCHPKKAAEFKDNFTWGDFVFFLKPDIDGRSIFLCEDCYNDDDIRKLCEELV